MFTSCQNKGFQMKFENGLTISVQFGTGNYCERRSYSHPYNSEMSEEIIQSENAEIAIWDESNVWFNFGSDTVAGFASTDDVADWILRVKNSTSILTV